MRAALEMMNNLPLEASTSGYFNLPVVRLQNCVVPAYSYKYFLAWCHFWRLVPAVEQIVARPAIVEIVPNESK